MRDIPKKPEKKKKEPTAYDNLTSKKDELTTLNLRIPTRDKEEILKLIKDLNQDANTVVKVTQPQLVMVGFKLLQKELEKQTYNKILSKL